ncbi:MAG: HEAT repeat domain-containing protein [Gemmatimonadota bacterium]|nr:HEAT repeat domain-containing protein [Gemmatimonadota bacterium]MDH3368826.1 HEAT repeat domain-containing protein [Gemmatimonadota bacterium]MDH3477074.1 HEAT repeat domain-containing protein [Gemmatimonadota bacterium]MDH3570845.1 HEAT repeat domain-containing protein [Gemmatimonadota bacterium]MDH5551185.1 HEAT repeat domain-containing protein [Gemmatimonadota bacterium]
MCSRRFLRRSAPSWCLSPIRCVSSVLISLLLATPVLAQDEAVVDQLAGILAAEDARRFDQALLAAAARYPDPVVRRHAALAIGRIEATAGTPLLVELLADVDSTVQEEAAFALGLLGDPEAVPPLRDRALALLRSPGTAGTEAATALAMIGGSEASRAFDEFLTQSLSGLESGAAPAIAVRAVGEAWRLGAAAPVATLRRLAALEAPEVRRRAIYSLARLRAPDAGGVLLNATNDTDGRIRAVAVQALTAAFADSANLGRAAVGQVVSRLTDDEDAGVRIQALRALATYGDPELTGSALDHLGDPDVNARVQAVAALGRLGGNGARAGLLEAERDRVFAIRREALLGLSRLDRATAIRRAAAWITDSDWQLRASGAAALGVLSGDTAIAWLERLLGDADGRVAAAALTALSRADSSWARELAPELLSHLDPVVRALAANAVRDAPSPTDIAALVEAYARAQRDPVPDARIAVVEALGAVAALGPTPAYTVEDRFLSRFPTCDDYLVRRSAERHLSVAARRWGPAYPTATGRDIDDYRAIARSLLLPAERNGTLPSLLLDTERGAIVIALYAADAPMTVNALLELVNRGYFDGTSWHRVVPDFVVQGGDPRGDGWGGPGFAQRDEVNRRRYETGTVGMALSGPDTGGSQFFIALASQPHLDGTYTVFGVVQEGMEVLRRTTQGDRIRTVRRR